MGELAEPTKGVAVGEDDFGHGGAVDAAVGREALRAKLLRDGGDDLGLGVHLVFDDLVSVDATKTRLGKKPGSGRFAATYTTCETYIYFGHESGRDWACELLTQIISQKAAGAFFGLIKQAVIVRFHPQHVSYD